MTTDRRDLNDARVAPPLLRSAATRDAEDAEGWARAVICGEQDASAGDLKRRAHELRAAGRTALVAELLTEVARRALQGE